MTERISDAHILTVGDEAPDFELKNIEGNTVRLSETWAFKPVVLVMLRHLGCIFCREQVARLRKDFDRFNSAGAKIVCVAQGDYQTGKAFSILFELPFEVLLCGDNLAIYQAYGLHRGNLGQLFGFKSMTRGIAAALKGARQGRVIGDGFQMAGTFIVNPDGKLRLVHRHADASDNIDNNILLDELARTGA